MSPVPHFPSEDQSRHQHLQRGSGLLGHVGGGVGGGGERSNGNFAGGRKELAMRLLSNCQEEEQSLDTTEEDDSPFHRVRLFFYDVTFKMMFDKQRGHPNGTSSDLNVLKPAF